MTAFEYGSVLISIVVGLGIARVLGGIATFLRPHDRAAHDWIVAAWCLALLLNLMSWWTAGWVALRAPEIPIAALFSWTVASAFLYLAACLLVPGRSIEGSNDSQTNFELPPNAFFVCLATHYCVSFVYMIANGVFSSGDHPVRGPVFVGLMIVLSGAGVAIETNRGHALLLAAWVATMATLVGLPPAIS